MVRDMTQGKPTRLILGFFVPLLLGSFFQQLYTLVDTIIVGQFVGTEAFAAVGAVGALSFMILGFVNGVTSGMSIAVSQFFGAGDYKNVRRMVYNACYVSLALAVIVTAGTMIGTRWLLTVMLTPENLMKDSYDYIIIIFAGTATLVLYNLPAGIMRALGDSRTPLYFLGVACVLNIALDLVFTLALNMGVRGAALATVISQLVSGLLCARALVKQFPVLRSSDKQELKPSKALIGKGLKFGVPMGLQFSITAIGSVILQTSVNTLGSNVVAAITASSRINMVTATVMEMMGVTMATYNGQNIGAKKPERIKQGMRSAACMMFGYSIVMGLLLGLFGRTFSLVFLHADETEVIGMVGTLMWHIGLGYPLLACVFLFRNGLQGLGYSTTAMFAGLCEMAARVFIAFLVPVYGFPAACFSNPAAWLFATAMLLPTYLVIQRRILRAPALDESAAR